MTTRRAFLSRLAAVPLLGGLIAVTDFPDWQAPQAHATAISTTGAPPLVFERILNLNFGQAIAAGATFTVPASGQLAVNQPAYEIGMFVATSAVLAPIVSVELQWYDTFSSFLVDTEIYYFYSGNVSNHLIHGRGPSKADGLVMIIKNYSGTGAVTVGWNLMQTSRTFTRELWKTVTKGGVQPVYPGLTAAVSDAAANMLAAESHVVTASNTTTVILPLYTGSVRLYGTTSDTVAGNSRWSVLPATDQVAGQFPTFQGANGESGFASIGVSSLYAPGIALPRSQCQLAFINNNSSASETLTAAVAVQEDRA